MAFSSHTGYRHLWRPARGAAPTREPDRSSAPPESASTAGGRHRAEPSHTRHRGLVPLAVVTAALLAGGISGGVIYATGSGNAPAQASSGGSGPQGHNYPMMVQGSAPMAGMSHDQRTHPRPTHAQPGHVTAGEPAQLGDATITVRQVYCGDKIPPSTRGVWAQHEEGLPCIVGLGAVTGSQPVTLSAAEQTMTDSAGKTYQVSSLQDFFPWDHVYGHQLSPDSKIHMGCLLFTLDPGTHPTSLTLHGDGHTVVVDVPAGS